MKAILNRIAVVAFVVTAALPAWPQTSPPQVSQNIQENAPGTGGTSKPGTPGAPGDQVRPGC